MDTIETESAEGLREQAKSLHDRANDLRSRLYVMTAELKRSREAFARALSAYASGLPHTTQVAATRAYIASSQAERAARQNEMAMAPAVADSVVDRSASYSHGGSAADHVRRQHKNGGYRRGSFPAAARVMPQTVRPPKLPSER